MKTFQTRARGETTFKLSPQKTCAYPKCFTLSSTHSSSTRNQTVNFSTRTGLLSRADTERSPARYSTVFLPFRLGPLVLTAMQFAVVRRVSQLWAPETFADASVKSYGTENQYDANSAVPGLLWDGGVTVAAAVAELIPAEYVAARNRSFLEVAAGVAFPSLAALARGFQVLTTDLLPQPWLQAVRFPILW